MFLVYKIVNKLEYKLYVETRLKLCIAAKANWNKRKAAN